MRGDNILEKREAAQIAAYISAYRASYTIEGRCTKLTPMLDSYKEWMNAHKVKDTADLREKFLRVARYLGWDVRKDRNECVFENGLQIWDGDGN